MAEELTALGEVVVGVGPGAEPVVEALGQPLFQPEDDERTVPEGAYRETPVFPTDPDRVFWALQGGACLRSATRTAFSCVSTSDGGTA